MPLHHIGINVANTDEAREFYLAALKPLGYKIKMSLVDGEVLGLGSGCAPDFWIAGPNAPNADGSEKRHGGASAQSDDAVKDTAGTGKARQQTGPMHIAFGAANRQQVRDFHQAAIAAGGVCNGTPGLRPEYFATYYGAFVLDPQGRNIEAVCMSPGFWAEPWGVIGWGAVGVLLGGVGGVYAQWAGLL